MSDTTTTTTTPSSDLPPGISPPPAGGGNTSNVPNGPGYLGVGYQQNQTGQPLVVYEDGTVGTLDDKGQPPTKNGPTGAPQKYVVIQPGQTIVDTNGVPAPYSAPVDTSQYGGTPYVPIPTTVYVPAKYREGDEVRELGSMSPEMRAQVLQTMQQKGLLKDNATPSDWWSAMKQVMSLANSTGNDWMGELQKMPNVGTAAQVRPIYQIKLDSPEDLQAIYRKAYTSVTGGGQPSQDELDRYVNAYQQIEREDQYKQIGQQQEVQNRQDIAAGKMANPAPFVPGGAVMGGPSEGLNPADASPGPDIQTYTPPISAQQYAEQQVRALNPGMAQQYANLQVHNAFMNLIANGVR